MKDLIKKNKIITAVVVILLIVALFVSFGGKDSEAETLTVAPADFVKQVSVSGKVVALRSVDLAFDQSGRVSRVYAKVGDQVSSGKILASVENGDAYANVLQREANLEAAQARLADLLNGTRPEEISIARQEVTSAESAVTQRLKGLSDAIKASYSTGDDALRRYADQLFTNPRTASVTFKYQIDSNLKAELERERYELEQMLVAWNLQVNGIISKEQIFVYADQAIDHLEDIRSFLDKMSIAVNSIIASSNLSETTLDGYKTDIALARTNVNTAISSITSAETLYKSAQSSLQSAKDNLSLKEAGATPEEIKAQEAIVKSEEASLTNAQAQYRKTLITAPFSGIITKMDVEVGGQASVSVPQISMISKGNFIIESFIPEINISSITVGNEAEATLDAYGEEVVFSAHVINVDPAETIKDGVSTYKVELEFDELDPRIRSGMTANVLITTLKKENVLSVPQGIIERIDGKNYVYKLVGDTKVKQEVSIGEVSSMGSAEILSGLAAGDVVLLTGKTN